jgi:hypothetical protein
MPDFILPMKKKQEVIEPCSPALWQLSWEAGTTASAARVKVIMLAKNEQGEWSDEYEDYRATMEDERDGEGNFEQPRLVFNAFGVMLDAVIPADDPRVLAMVALGLPGGSPVTVREMGEWMLYFDAARKVAQQTQE